MMRSIEAVTAPKARRKPVFHTALQGLRPVVEHPIASAVAGIGLLVSGLFELIECLFSFETVVDAYQGVIVMGVVTTLRSLAYMVEGAERLSKHPKEAAPATGVEVRTEQTHAGP